MKLNKKDYIDILKFYNIKYPNNASLSTITNLAEDIIAKKLCSCIKKVNNDINDESIKIAICRKNVIHKKGYKINRFTCKKKPKLLSKKKTKTKIWK